LNHKKEREEKKSGRAGGPLILMKKVRGEPWRREGESKFKTGWDVNLVLFNFSHLLIRQG